MPVVTSRRFTDLPENLELQKFVDVDEARIETTGHHGKWVERQIDRDQTAARHEH
jgi:hypothetical protein